MGTTGKMLFSGGSNVDYSNVNPDPINFKITRCYHENGFTVAYVNYPDCTTYEGHKVLVFSGDRVDELYKAKKLDPHFCNNNNLIARFAPNKYGYEALQKLIN